MKKLNQLKAGSILSYIQMALSVVVELVFTQAMIKALGQSEYGLYNTVASTISMLSILSLGFNSSYVRYYARYKASGDKDSIQKLNGMFLIVFTVIGFIAFVCGIYLTFHLNLVFDKGLSVEEYELAKTLMILLTITLAISFPMSVFGNIISAHENYVFLKLTSMLRTVLGPMISMPLLLLGFRSITLVTVSLVVSIFTDLCNLHYVLRKLKEKFVFHSFEKGVFKDLFIYTSFIAINIIVDQINTNVDNLLLARFKGTKEVAIYAVGQRLYTAYVRFSSAISGVFTPRIHMILNTTNNEIQLKRKLTELFTKVGRIQFYILTLVSTGIVFFGRTFISFWAGEGFENSYYVALLLIIPGTIPLIQNLGIEIQRAENKHQFRSIAYLVMAFINLFCSYYLCQLYGAIGSTVGTAVSLLLANGLIMNIYYHKKCNIDILYFWKNIVDISKGLLIPIICGIAMNSIVSTNTISSFFIAVIVYTAVFIVAMYLISMNEFEKELIHKAVKKIIKR